MGFIADILSLFTLSKMEDSKRKRMNRAEEIAAERWRAERNLPPLALETQFYEELCQDRFAVWRKVATPHKGDPFWDRIITCARFHIFPSRIDSGELDKIIAKEYFAQLGYDYLTSKERDKLGYWRAIEAAREEAGKDIIDRLVDKLF